MTKVAEVLGVDRLRVGAEHGTQSLVLQRSAQLEKAPLKAGDDVRVVIDDITDAGSRLELRAGYAPNLVTALATLDGRPVGTGAPGPLTRQLRDRYWASHEEPRYSTPVRYDEPG